MVAAVDVVPVVAAATVDSERATVPPAVATTVGTFSEAAALLGDGASGDGAVVVSFATLEEEVAAAYAALKAATAEEKAVAEVHVEAVLAKATAWIKKAAVEARATEAAEARAREKVAREAVETRETKAAAEARAKEKAAAEADRRQMTPLMTTLWMGCEADRAAAVAPSYAPGSSESTPDSSTSGTGGGTAGPGALPMDFALPYYANTAWKARDDERVKWLLARVTPDVVSQLGAVRAKQGAGSEGLHEGGHSRPPQGEEVGARSGRARVHGRRARHACGRAWRRLPRRVA